jgi:adenylate cyclase
VNMAARLESLATPGSILVSSAVHTRTRPFFEFSFPQQLAVRGMDEPVEVYETLSARDAPIGARGLPGIVSTHLGRHTELQLLRDRLDTFLNDRGGGVVTIVGEAGVGKSRLVQEWLSPQLSTPPTTPERTSTIWHGRGLPYTQGTGYGVFQTLFRDALRRYAVPGIWESRVSEAFRPFIRRLLELPAEEGDQTVWEHLPPERLNQLTTLAMREWLLNEAEEQPLILVLDDYHWADDLSRDALQTLVALTSEARILYCVISRPRATEPIGRPAPGAVRMLDIEIQPLSGDESRQLLDSLVDLSGFPEATVATILARAEGNPFYIEEFVRMMIEQEALRLKDGRWQAAPSLVLETLSFPTSLRGLMLARIDRLPDNLRYLLQDAAVMGLQFDLELLQAVEQRLRRVDTIRPMVERLEQLDLLEARQQVGPTIYAFRHILTQETVYQSVLRHERPELHGVVAETIEEVRHDEIEQYTEILALHWDRSRNREKALIYTLRAGDRARNRFANREAVGYYSRALQLSQHVADSDLARWLAAVGLGDVQQHIGENEEAIAFYRAALDERTGAPAEDRADVMLKIGRAWDKLGNREKADAWLKSAATEITHSGKRSPAVEAEIYNALGWLTLRSGDLPAAQALLTQATILVSDTDDFDVLASALNRLGAIHFSKGEWEKAVDVVQRSLAIRERLGDLLGIARSSNNLGILQRDNGDWQGALRTLQRSLEALQMIGDTEGAAMAHTNMGNVYIDLGDWQQAEENLRRSYDLAQKIAVPYEKAQANMNLGRLYLHKGEYQPAERYLDTAISLYAQVGVSANPNLIDAYWLRAMLHLEQGQLEQASQWRERNLALLREGTGAEDGESPEWGRYHQLCGRLALAHGQVQEALGHLDRAKSIFLANRSMAEVGRTAYWYAQAQLRSDNASRARDELTEARDIFATLGAKTELARTTQFLQGLAKATT